MHFLPPPPPPEERATQVMPEQFPGIRPFQCSRLEDSYTNRCFRSQHSGFVRKPVFFFNCTYELPSKEQRLTNCTVFREELQDLYRVCHNTLMVLVAL